MCSAGIPSTDAHSSIVDLETLVALFEPGLSPEPVPPSIDGAFSPGIAETNCSMSSRIDSSSSPRTLSQRAGYPASVATLRLMESICACLSAVAAWSASCLACSYRSLYCPCSSRAFYSASTLALSAACTRFSSSFFCASTSSNLDLGIFSSSLSGFCASAGD